jgi:hypothetical protein
MHFPQILPVVGVVTDHQCAITVNALINPPRHRGHGEEPQNPAFAPKVLKVFV